MKKKILPLLLIPFLFVVSPPAQGGLGDFLWTMDLEKITGGLKHQGVEFDGTYFWVSGLIGAQSYLFKISPQGVLIQKYQQPSAGFGAWTDLVWDGQFLYAGNDPNRPGYLIQISTTTGLPTGVIYGPYPITPLRALGYDSTTDSFWSGTWSSDIYQLKLNGSSQSYPNWGLQGIYGMAVEESTSSPMLWIWSQDGSGALASEFDILAGQPTGRTFDGGQYGIAAGVCSYDAGGGQWILVGVVQGAPDMLVAFDLGTLKETLEVDVDVIEAEVGGTANFSLQAGPAHANRFYGLFGSASGGQPGIQLPGGMATLPVNWDWFTALLLKVGFAFGTLDGNGDATESLVFPPNLPIADDLNMTFAYCLQGPPWDFASNAVEILLQAPLSEYSYDDGTSENILGWTSGGELCWMHYFECTTTDTIKSISTTFGCPVYPGYSPGNGTPCMFYIWEDPTDDFDPTDAVLLDSVASTVQNVDTDIFNEVSLNAPVTVSKGFWVGCSLDHAAGQFVAPIDGDGGPVPGSVAWFAGTPGAPFDPVISNNSQVLELGSVGIAGVFMLRAQNQ